MSINLANVFYTYMTGTPFERQALNDVSLTIEKGEILAIIGHTGSGKSTMLKALAGVFNPDKGSIDLKGHSVSLMAIGVGFQKEVTGRENILLSGMLLGFSEEEIRAKMPEIIEFADLEKAALEGNPELFRNHPPRLHGTG